MTKSSLHPRVQRQSMSKDDSPITQDDGPVTIGHVVASLHAARPVCIACIACNARIARIARIARNDCNNCNDEVTFKDSRRSAWSVPASRLPNEYADDRSGTARTFLSPRRGAVTVQEI